MSAEAQFVADLRALGASSEDLGHPMRHAYRRCLRACPDRKVLGQDHCYVCGCSKLQHGISTAGGYR